jgi:hypothetical protein
VRTSGETHRSHEPGETRGTHHAAAALAFGSEAWKTDCNELKDLGGRASTRHSARQAEDARFWLAPGPAIYYPLVRQLAGARNLDLLDSPIEFHAALWQWRAKPGFPTTWR